MTKDEQIKKIKEEVLDLKNSPLYQYRTENNYFPVIGEGIYTAKIMFIGEAPGRNEAKTGRPFCGTAGKVLDGLLEYAGIKREEVYITNIVKDRPQMNRDPESEEIKIYGPFLDRQIEIIQPKVIATLGRYSMDYILRKYGLLGQGLSLSGMKISEGHGKIFEAKANYGTIKIAVLYHPCVAVYNPTRLPELKKDFEILKNI
ncbi:MAG: hypothetical protein A2541_00140 [Candidatus Taylorbacteria bacterium RIFOXYD2_FULL_36_9]|uniref:Type-4 uracil-DNA glycosylase n=1 Tax=Candidatus Taylorbacteria bacterium RIFOXYD2_FULL_36_9 TaxID=1802338 RepID=A0A1G2PDY4_9BACT|nr:MAG: hypothetical protein A2541_00140 [Candidatus Taylorbacteria bacterium RIFOXYD2_FULL_36_9]